MIKYHCVNGQITPAEQAVLHISDLAILRGYGIFDFFLVKSGQPLFFEDYLDRFIRSASLLNLDMPLGREALHNAVLELIRANGLPEASIRLVLTGGYSDDGYTPSEANLLIMEHPFAQAKAELYGRGLHLFLHDYQREVPEVKSINYLTGIRLLPYQKEKGADDVLYHDKGWIRESARSNFLMLTQDDVLVTPAKHILMGVTRKKVLEVAAGLLKIEERDIHLQELEQAKEAYLSSTTKGVMPVTMIDGQPVADGRPGPWAKRLQEAFVRVTQNYLLEKA